MYAAAGGHLSIVQLLKEAEAGMQTTTGQTALHISVLQQKPEVVQLLLPLEGHIANKKGQTAFQLAQEKGVAHVLKAFAV